MEVARDGRRGGRLGPCLLCAGVLHAALFVLTSFRAAHAAVHVEATPAPAEINALNVDIEPAVGPATTPPGGGSPIVGPSLIANANLPIGLAHGEVRPPPAAQPVPVVEPLDPHERASSVSDETKADALQVDADEELALAGVRADNDRRERAMAAASAGAGPGTGGGPGGIGGGWGIPAIRGITPFGNGSHGALTGRVCFLPMGTLRIADVRTCRYVAKVYADTLDVPERQYFDGFPGVTNRSEWFLIDYTGTFTVTGYGTYIFRLHSDDGSYLYIDDALVIENDGKHAPESRSGRVQLAVGEHRIRVLYAQTNDRMALQLFVRAPGTAEGIFTTHL